MISCVGVRGIGMGAADKPHGVSPRFREFHHDLSTTRVYSFELANV